MDSTRCFRTISAGRHRADNSRHWRHVPDCHRSAVLQSNHLVDGNLFKHPALDNRTGSNRRTIGVDNHAGRHENRRSIKTRADRNNCRSSDWRNSAKHCANNRNNNRNRTRSNGRRMAARILPQQELPKSLESGKSSAAGKSTGESGEICTCNCTDSDNIQRNYVVSSAFFTADTPVFNTPTSSFNLSKSLS